MSVGNWVGLPGFQLNGDNRLLMSFMNVLKTNIDPVYCDALHKQINVELLLRGLVLHRVMCQTTLKRERKLLVVTNLFCKSVPVGIAHVVDIIIEHADGGRWRVWKNRFGAHPMVFDEWNDCLNMCLTSCVDERM